MLGNVANVFTFIFASLYLQVFYTDVLGINAGLVGKKELGIFASELGTVSAPIAS